MHKEVQRIVRLLWGRSLKVDVINEEQRAVLLSLLGSVAPSVSTVLQMKCSVQRSCQCRSCRL